MAEGEVTERDDRDRFAEVLREAVSAVEDEGIPFAVFGSLASSVWGRPGASGDVDLLVKPQDAGAALAALDRAGFETEKMDPGWIFKAFKDGVLVDLIFKVRGDVYFDDEMAERIVPHDYRGVKVPLLGPEDTLLVEAVGTESETPEHWFNALSILGRRDMDWKYLLRRSRIASRRMLALLIYAQSTDVPIPDEVVHRLYETVYRPHGATP